MEAGGNRSYGWLGKYTRSLAAGTVERRLLRIGGGEEEVIVDDKDRKVPEWALKDGTILYTTTNGGKVFVLPPGERQERQIFQRDFIPGRATCFS